MLDGFSGLLVACGVLVAGAAGVLVIVAINHWIDERAARRERTSDIAAPQPSPRPVVRIPPAPAPDRSSRVQPPQTASSDQPVLLPDPVVVIEPPAPEPREPVLPPSPHEPRVSNADIRRWARATGLHVADRGVIPARIRQAWSDAHPSSRTS